MAKIAHDFPVGICDVKQPEDTNPAIQLFGKRYFSEQQVMELLAEFLLLLVSKKEIGECGKTISSFLPGLEQLRDWPAQNPLAYYPKVRLNLKLFSFLGSSRLETRHETHREHCRSLWRELKQRINAEDDTRKDDVLSLLSNLFLGFWGTGAQRTWCAQSFLPFCEGLLSGEIIWKEKKANKVNSWDDALSLFQYSQRVNFARGGELLFLQVCNALRQDAGVVQQWLRDSDREQSLTLAERDPARLLGELQKSFDHFFSETPTKFNDLADFIDREIDSETASISDGEETEGRRAICGWCPQESWREGYLFAVELRRLLRADIDILEAVELLQIACAMQLMRSLVAQSCRHSSNFTSTDGLDYRLFFSEPDEANRNRKTLSGATLVDVTREIYEAVRAPDIINNITPERRKSVYSAVDSKYGHGLYVRTGKSIGLIVPRRGSGARFVLTDKLLRFFILSLVPAERMTLDTFKRQIERHFGFVFDESRLQASPHWRDKANLLDGHTTQNLLLEQMLEASGALVKLSDSCSLVKNPFWGKE